MLGFHGSLEKVKGELTSLFNKHEAENPSAPYVDPAVDAAKQAREIASASSALVKAIARLGSPQSDMDEVSSTITRENLKLVRMVQKNLKLM